MAFSSVKLKPESGANRIKSADDAYSFMVHMRLFYQNKPHSQAARQGSTMLAYQTRAKFKRGGPLERQPAPKAGLRIKDAPAAILESWRGKPVASLSPPRGIAKSANQAFSGEGRD